jgi:general secretion pathway protein J
MASDCLHAGKRGFTLVEILAALAIGSVVIVAAAALLHNFAFAFDRGTNRVSNGERLALAAERLAIDIGSARFVVPSGAAAAFLGQPAKVSFIGAPGLDSVSRGEEAQLVSGEVVGLTVETNGDETQIVRRRAAWPGLRTRLEAVSLADPVVLLEGSFDAAFSFGRVAPDGTLTWADSWTNQQTLPHLVKLTLRDRASGVDLFGGADFVIHADAAPACARADATADCLSNPASAPQPTPAGSPQQQAATP